jgi:hypothetical protein
MTIAFGARRFAAAPAIVLATAVVVLSPATPAHADALEAARSTRMPR